MNQSAQLFSRACSVIPGGVNSPVRAFRNVDWDPFFVQSAKGAYITDADGRQLIDYIGTWGPAILGHAPQLVLDAVHAAVDRGLGYGIPAPAEVDMAEMITDMVPSVEKVRMVNSGTEATMSAIRLARGYTGRRKIIKFIVGIGNTRNKIGPAIAQFNTWHLVRVECVTEHIFVDS